MPSIKNIKDFAKMKQSGQRIAMITCYDYAFARIITETETDVILVGDSLGMVVAGFDTTIPVTLDQIIYHTGMVRRGAPQSFIVADLPFMSYHVSIEDTLRNSGRVMKETGANAVKLEGGRDFAAVVEALTRASIPVMGHLGLTPQSVHKLGGYSVQGRDEEQRAIIMEDALLLQKAGAFAIVLEMVPEQLAEEITRSLDIPTIGIGAGRYCNGQVLVINDMLGLNKGFNPKFLKRYADVFSTAQQAIQNYCTEVKDQRFPAEENVFK